MRIRLKIVLCVLVFFSLLLGFGGGILINVSFCTELNAAMDAAYNAHQFVLATLDTTDKLYSKPENDVVTDTLDELTEKNSNLCDALRLSNNNILLYEFSRIEIPSLKQNYKLGESIVECIKVNDDTVIRVCSVLWISNRLMYLELFRDISPLMELRSERLNTFRFIFIITAIIAATVAYILSLSFTRPLFKLIRTAHDIANGIASTRTGLTTSNELGQLAHDIDSIALELERLQASVHGHEQFTGSFSHEMKTPMTSIIGYADLIRSEQLSTAEQIEAANYIVNEGKRLENLSWKLLELLGVSNSKLELSPARPGDIIEDVIEHMRPIYEKQDIDLSCSYDNTVCPLDVSLFKSLLMNLMDNARKSIVEHGSIRISSAASKNGCVIKVIDNGKGIPKEALSHITEAFYRVDKSRSRSAGGVGLGLTLCAQIVAAHNGTIGFESEVGKGTTVTIILRSE